MKRVEGKVAIVTGAAQGMGAAFASRFIEEGAKVVLTDIAEQKGQNLADSLGANAVFIKHDVSSEKDWNKVVEHARSTFGDIDVLVNCAGILSLGSLETVDEAEFRRVMDINLVSVFLGMKAVFTSMRAAGGGSIINISSISGLVAVPSSSSYTASKFAVRGLTKAAAVDYGQYGIRVNSVHPGYIDTAMLEGILSEQEASENSVLHRMGKPDDIANMVLFLASDESSFATGSEFVVDGGFSSSRGAGTGTD